MCDLNNFSDWQKIDLHIHTNKSKETKENDYKGNFSVSILKEKLRDNNVSIFSLTDHNIINVEAYEEYVRIYSKSEKDPFPLIGFEADISHEEKTYHALLIFEEDIVKNQGFIQICASKVEELYENILDTKNRKTTFNKIIEKFDKNEFLFIVHSGNHKSIIDAYKSAIPEAQKKILIFENVGVEQGKEDKIRKFNEGFQQHLQNYLRAENYVPYMDFSDNHYIEKYPCKGIDENNLHKFFYIKGIQNYESLRLAFIDPTIRILNEKEKNELDIDLNNRIYIKELSMEEASLGKGNSIIEKAYLKFSPHLNVIIGGRSSGKSLLIDIIGKKLTGLSSESSKINYDYDKEKQKIKSNKDSSFVNQISINNSYLIYIKQNDIIEFFMNNDLSSLAKKSYKEQEYNSSNKDFLEKKKEILDTAEKISKLYKEIKENFQEDLYKVYAKDLVDLQLDGWRFKELKINSENYNFTEKTNSLDSLIENIQLLENDEFWKFTDDEKELLSKFKNLIISKKVFVTQKEQNYQIQNRFRNRVITLLQNKNLEISQNASKKQNAKSNIDDMVYRAQQRFKKFHELKILCDTLECFKLYTKLIIELKDEIKIIRETSEIGENDTFGALILNEVLNTSKTKLFLAFNEFPEIKNKIPFKNKLDNILKKIYESYNNPRDSLLYSDASSSKENSPGLNSEHYLKSILTNNDIQIIIIDQPEDNLGAKFITQSSDSLVRIIREAKFKKQIFLATHNASIVVFGDAESVIYAQNNSNRLKYTQILLEENKISKQIICENLDGGYEVFDNRRRKYNIKKLKGE